MFTGTEKRYAILKHSFTLSFTIELFPKAVIDDAKVSVDKITFLQYNDITGSYMTPKAIANMWLAFIM